MATGYPFYNALVPLPNDVVNELTSIRTALGQLPPAAYANEIALMTGSCSGAGNVYAISMTRSPSAYSNSMFLTFTPSSTITGAVTVNVNGLGAVSLVHGDGRPLVANDISPAHDVNIIYSDAQRVFYLISQNESINSATAASINTVTGDVTNLANQTVKYRSTGAPTNNPSPLSASITDNTIGGRDVQLNWNGYTQGALQADGLLLFFRPGSGTPAVTDASIQFNVTSTASYHLFQNIDMQGYCAGIAAYRRTENALEIGAIQTIPSWSVAAGTIDNRPSAGTVNGGTIVAGAVTADKTNIAAINSGTGGINALMVGNAQLVDSAVSDLKIAEGAVTAAKTALAAIDPTSGTLAINSVAANNIIAGTITGDKIFAGTITSEHITVGTLSAIQANLGTVNAGEITGSANINIAGSARFNGAYSASGYNWAVVANSTGGQQGGVWGYGINYGGYFIGAGDGSVGLRASCNGVNGTGLYGSAGLGGVGVKAAGFSNATGLYASADAGFGIYATSSTGTAIYGTVAGGNSVHGQASTGVGVYGQSSSGNGVVGLSSTGIGVAGTSSTTHGGWFTSAGTAFLTAAVTGVGTGSTTNGVIGIANSGGTGVGGSSSTGKGGDFVSGSGIGIEAVSTSGIAGKFTASGGAAAIFATGNGASPGGSFTSSSGTAVYAQSTSGYAFSAGVTTGYGSVITATSGSCYYGSNTTGGTCAQFRNSASGGTGLYGLSSHAGGYGCQIHNTAGGLSLYVGGSMQIDNSTLVVNLNADKLDGLHANNLCQKVNTQAGVAVVYPSDGSLWITSSVANVTTRLVGTNEINIYTSSDARIKHDIRKEVLGLDFINKLKPKTYRMNKDPGRLVHGFIAQDVGKLGLHKDDILFEEHSNGVLGTDYVALIAPLVKAVQELTKRVMELEGDSHADTIAGGRNFYGNQRAVERIVGDCGGSA
jgi:hypothetical protein